MENALQRQGFEGWLRALAGVISVIDNTGLPALQHKQAVAHAVSSHAHPDAMGLRSDAQASEFKEQMLKAKSLVENLSGGEMLPDDQDQVIVMLKGLRDQKK